ncbi:MAG: ribonuclease Z [Deltaproteobacteria bacterium]|nr:ribonuclease Z [Deltaproteobacteria bacterium]
MLSVFNAALTNDPFGDPGVYVEFKYRYAALLFDLGDLHALTPRKLLKVSHVFVSHAHMDHFIGFDHLLRICLGRDRQISLFGPPGFLRQVESKIGAYTWNLVENYSNDFTLLVTEVHPGHRITKRYACRKAFAPEIVAEESPGEGILLDERLFSVRGSFLDHQIPCLGFRLEAKTRINIMKNVLTEMGLPTGAWLLDLKDRIIRDDPDETPVRVWWRSSDRGVQERYVFLGDLRSRVVKVTPGQKIAYITDTVARGDTVRRIVDLARDADILFIEAAFLQEDVVQAERKYHLTAQQAGTMARMAGAKRMEIFHFSPKYKGCGECLVREAETAFSGHSLAI